MEEEETNKWKKSGRTDERDDPWRQKAARHVALLLYANITWVAMKAARKVASKREGR